MKHFRLLQLQKIRKTTFGFSSIGYNFFKSDDDKGSIADTTFT